MAHRPGHNETANRGDDPRFSIHTNQELKHSQQNLYAPFKFIRATLVRSLRGATTQATGLEVPREGQCP